MSYKTMFPQQMQDLHKEIRNHPDLVEDLKQIKDVGEWFARVATAAHVVVDGVYPVEDLPKLCDMLTVRLYQSRTQLIVTGAKKVK